MKKRGFTLIELLAVIVVLAVIALIAVPTILGVIERARKGALKDSAYGVIEAANFYYARNEGLSEVKEFVLKDGKFVSNDETLSLKGSIQGDGALVIDTAGKITLCINNKKTYAFKNYNVTDVTVGDGDVCHVEQNIFTNSYVTYLESQGSTIDGYYTKADVDSLLKDLEKKIVKEATDVDTIYPVGSIYTSIDSKNPSEIFGGTWVSFGVGKTIVGTDTKSEETGGSSSVKLTPSNIPSLTSTGSTTATNVTTNSTGSGYTIGYGSAWRSTTYAGEHYHSYYINIQHVDGQVTSGESLTSGLQGGGRVRYYGNTSSTGNHYHQSADYFANSISGVQAHTHTLTVPALTATTTYTNNSQTSISVQNPYITVYMWKRTA